MIDLLEGAFSPNGKTIAIAAPTSAPPTGVNVPSIGTNQEKSLGVRIFNPGATTVWVGWGNSAAVATTNSVIPTGVGVNSQQAVPIPPGACVALMFPVGTFYSAITTTAPVTIYITPGIGVD